MRKLPQALMLFFIVSSAHAGGECRWKIDSRIRLSGPDISLAQLKRIGIAFAAENPKVPQVPFAYSNRSWRDLVANYRRGDQIRAFELLGYGGKPFVWGYALIRGQCVVDNIMTAIS